MEFDYRGYRGPDVSFYQGNPIQGKFIDFNKMKVYGVNFVIIKVGQYTYEDPAFRYNWRTAKEVGIPRSGYWFLDVDDKGKVQAERFWELIKDDPGEGPLVVDFEDGSGSWPRLADFITRLKELSGYPDHMIWIYTGYYYWIEFGPRTEEVNRWFQKHPIWLAAYTLLPDKVKAPVGYKIPLWQQGTTIVWGPDLGVHSLELDWNLLNGGKEVFELYFKGGSTPTDPQEPPQGGDKMQYEVVWSQGVSRRTAPTTSNSYTGLLYTYNEVVEVVEENIPDQSDPTNINKRWVKFADGYYGASNYPNSAGVPQVRMKKVVEPAPSDIEKAVVFFKDGTSLELFPK